MSLRVTYLSAPDPSVTIVSGPYTTEAIALANCATGTGTGMRSARPMMSARPPASEGHTLAYCSHLGQPTGERVLCSTCSGRVELKLFECGVYGECTLTKPVKGTACCTGCPAYEPGPTRQPMNTNAIRRELGRPVKWAYGVTTVPGRRNDLLPRTLGSLRAGGFDSPTLFVDGGSYDDGWAGTNLRTVFRESPAKTFGNWVLSLWELYLREPTADRYAIFQDDLVCVRNLRGYLDGIEYPSSGYLNLYSFPQNEALAKGRRGFYESNQMGRGAVALVFDKEAMKTVLSSRSMLDRVETAVLGQRSVDGGVVNAMTKAGFKEYVHAPSLVQHTGHKSSMGNPPYPVSTTFPGEDYDALSLLGAS